MFLSLGQSAVGSWVTEEQNYPSCGETSDFLKVYIFLSQYTFASTAAFVVA